MGPVRATSLMLQQCQLPPGDSEMDCAAAAADAVQAAVEGRRKAPCGCGDLTPRTAGKAVDWCTGCGESVNRQQRRWPSRRCDVHLCPACAGAQKAVARTRGPTRPSQPAPGSGQARSAAAGPEAESSQPGPAEQRAAAGGAIEAYPAGRADAPADAWKSAATEATLEGATGQPALPTIAFMPMSVARRLTAIMIDQLQWVVTLAEEAAAGPPGPQRIRDAELAMRWLWFVPTLVLRAAPGSVAEDSDQTVAKGVR